jgi:ribonuclease P protein component
MSSRSATNGKPDDPPSLPPESSQSFPKSRRLLRRADFQRVYSEGAKIAGPYFLLFVFRRDDSGSCRVGLTASRKVGKAVKRNRAKRLLREAVRRNWQSAPAGCDCVLHVRARLCEAPYAEVEAEVLRAMRRARATLKAE